MKPLFISTSIAYANAAPHLGFALELIQADAIARFAREIENREVFFSTGTDEYGSKIYKTAKEKNVPTQKFVDENAVKFQKLAEVLQISNDGFIRTTEDRHRKVVQKLWSKLAEKNFFEKKEFHGKYCSGCETFLTEKDLNENGECPHHLKKPEEISEENYFFRLEKFDEKILNEIEIFPDFRKTEIYNFAKKGLKNVSFSRPAKVLPWGISVPGDDSQTIYVWCDALTNYFSILDFPSKKFEQFWNGEKVHLIGKDILRFHAIFWPAMLRGADFKIPNKILVHGFITSEGQKMSKSIGNVVDPFKICEQFSADALRFFLLKEIPFGADGDFCEQRFREICNAFLANSLGNLVSRTRVLSEKIELFRGEKLTKNFAQNYEKMENEIRAAMKKFELNFAIGAIFEFVDFLNSEISRTRPWENLAK